MTEPAAPAPQPQPAAPFSEAEDKQYATLATFLNIILLIPALIFYFAFKDRGPRIAEQSKENLNWTINITVIVVAAWILDAIFTAALWWTGVGFILGLLFGLIAWAGLIVNLIFSIIGGVQLSGDQKTSYRYPFAIRVIK
jgi:uncharacterized Tic20 family protein